MSSSRRHVTSANRGDTWTAPSLVDTGAGDQWFPGDPSCEFCAVFHGDYIGLAYGRDGHANAIWTDMRDPSPFTQGLFLQFI